MSYAVDLVPTLRVRSAEMKLQRRTAGPCVSAGRTFPCGAWNEKRESQLCNS